MSTGGQPIPRRSDTHVLSMGELKRIVQAAQVDLTEEDLRRLYPGIAGQLAAVLRLREVEVGEAEPATVFVLEASHDR